jgi:hypothetical protein
MAVAPTGGSGSGSSKRLRGVDVEIVDDGFEMADEANQEPIIAALGPNEQPDRFYETEFDARGNVLVPLADDIDEIDEFPEDVPHDANLAEWVDEADLTGIVGDLIDGYDSDRRSRKEWEEDLEKGLQMLGVKLEELNKPFPGACSATMPVIEENARAFQARAVSAMFPPEGPVKAKIWGAETKERNEAAARVRTYMNWQTLEQMPEYFSNTDQMLYYLALVGSSFRKVWWDERKGRPCARFLKIDNIVVNYGAPDLYEAERITHVFELSKSDYNKMVAAGVYRKLDLSAAPETDETEKSMETAVDKITGQSKPAGENALGDRYEFLEMCVELDLPGFEDMYESAEVEIDEDGIEIEIEAEPTGISLPYVVTIEKTSRQIVSIYRNYDAEDPERKPIQHYVHYKFMPGLGFYGQGYIQLLGNLQKAATTGLRALVDSGQFANLQGGFKAKGLRVNNDSGEQAIGLGEFVEVENFGEDIRKAIMALPFKEPSSVLLQLVTGMNDIARRLGAVVDIDIASVGTKEAPVGTTQAMLEQSLSQLSAVYKRLYRAQTEEFKILKRVNRENLPAEYPFQIEGADASVMAADFDVVEIVPVADPAAYSEAQKIMKAQGLLQMASQAPDLYDRRETHMVMLKAMNVDGADPEKLLPNRSEPEPMDPATEMYSILMGRPVKAYPAQNHMAHIQFLTAKKGDPMIQQAAGGNPQQAQQLAARIDSLIGMHMAYMSRQEIQQATGMQLPPAPDYSVVNQNDNAEYDEMDEQASYNIAAAQAQAAQQLAQQRQQMAQMQQNQQAAQNPALQIEQAKLQLKQQELQLNTQEAQQKAQQGQQDMMLDAQAAQFQQELNRREQQRKDRETQIREQNIRADNVRADNKLALDRQKVAIQARQAAQRQNPPAGDRR